jgi:hypothetical protein
MDLKMLSLEERHMATEGQGVRCTVEVASSVGMQGPMRGGFSGLHGGGHARHGPVWKTTWGEGAGTHDNID